MVSRTSSTGVINRGTSGGDSGIAQNATEAQILEHI